MPDEVATIVETQRDVVESSEIIGIAWIRRFSIPAIQQRFLLTPVQGTVAKADDGLDSGQRP